MKFKKGDRVRIKSNLMLGESYGSPANWLYYIDGMASPETIVIIKEIFSNAYTVENYTGYYNDEMLEPVENYKISEINNIKIIKLKKKTIKLNFNL